MSKDTKGTIRDVAKQLFNERGFNNVSTKDIADTLGISKGNLTYHFKKKEDIVEAILEATPSTRPHDAPTTLEELDLFFEDIQQTIQDNAFYFWHHAQLAQVSKKIHTLQNKTFQENTSLLLQALFHFEKDGIIKPEEYPGEYERLVNSLLITCVYWIPFCELRGEDAHTGLQQQAWSIIYPFFTDKGKRSPHIFVTHRLSEDQFTFSQDSRIIPT